MQQIERDCFSVAKRMSIYIRRWAFLALLGAPYIYEISSVRVKNLAVGVTVHGLVRERGYEVSESVR